MSWPVARRLGNALRQALVEFAAEVGVPQSVGQEFNDADKAKAHKVKRDRLVRAMMGRR